MLFYNENVAIIIVINDPINLRKPPPPHSPVVVTDILCFEPSNVCVTHCLISHMLVFIKVAYLQ